MLDGYGQMLKPVVSPKSVLGFVCQVDAIMFLCDFLNEFPEATTQCYEAVCHGTTNTVL